MNIQDFLTNIDSKLLVAVGAGAVLGASGLLAISSLKKGDVIDFATRSEHPKWSSGDARKQYCVSHSNIAESSELQELRELTAQHERGVMESTPDVGQFLTFITRMVKAKNIIEVGSFTGVALLRMVQELPADGKAFALDVQDDYVKVGKPIMEKAGVLSKIDYRIAPALDSLVQLKEEGYTGKIDLCFIDADKGNYPNYYKLCLELLRPGGIIVFDNSLYGNKVLTDLTSVPNCYIHETNEKGAVDNRVTSLLLPIGDGCLVLRKNDE
ncbi:uncharacterized protein LOC134812243 [Bolinopsis microptera]|uniref:uncharacterized protein LOC134812243 n=1 Tax=Bolinopsis microptera TaxID=2820187 RepID=UPI003078C227